MIGCDAQLMLRALPGIPIVQPGDDLGLLVREALVRAGLALQRGDVVVVASKLVSRSEGRFVALSSVSPRDEAVAMAARCGKDPRVVEMILSESSSVVRETSAAIIVRHRLGFVCANAGIDFSNARPAAANDDTWMLLLPIAPDASAERLRKALAQDCDGIGVVISDSFGRPFRIGTLGAAIGLAGLPALWDQRGRTDLFGRTLEITVTGLADQVAAAADLVAGQADEGRGVVLVRGLHFEAATSAASQLSRAPEQDVFAPGGHRMRPE
jgi:coenzyme F420-0:L-glutamate ligase/coenzyme F420-1:gamma-L-glutamate ligase